MTKVFERILAAVAVMLQTSAVWSAPISADQARKGMVRWLRARPDAHMQARLGSVGSIRTVSDTDGQDLFHVVHLDGGGFVVTSADDRILPVIAFSDTGSVVESDQNPLWRMLQRDLPQRRAAVQTASANVARALTATAPVSTTDEEQADEKPLEQGMAEAVADWADLLSDTEEVVAEGDTVKKPLTAGLAIPDTVRVPMLMATKWNQATDASGSKCFNYYTPNNYVCGCVATAAAQLMRKHAYPTASVSAKTFTCWVDSTSTSKTMKGGSYDWANMPALCSDITTDAQRQAIGKLCYDVGVATRMNWTSSGSGACLVQTSTNLVSTFGYKNSMCYDTSSTISSAILQRAIFANLDGGYPVLLGIRDSAGKYGHAIVADGYGVTAGTFYTHLNLGWAGNSDAWYALPQIGTGYNFTVVDTLVYNVFPSQTGELITGRVLRQNGLPIAGATVTAQKKSYSGTTTVTATTNERGIYALHVASGTWTVTATASGYTASSGKSVKVSNSSTATFSNLNSQGYTRRSTGSVGNSWGNDFTLVSNVPLPKGFLLFVR